MRYGTQVGGYTRHFPSCSTTTDLRGWVMFQTIRSPGSQGPSPSHSTCSKTCIRSPMKSLSVSNL